MNLALLRTIGPYAVIAVLVAICVLEARALSQEHQALTRLQGDYARDTATVAALSGTVEKCKTDVRSLAGDVENMLRERAADAAKRDSLIAERDAALEQRNVASSNERKARDAIFATRTCAAITEVRLDACGDLAARLLHRTTPATSGPG